MKITSLAKITRPKLSGIVARERLFGRLDAGRKKSVIWISAQAGSGKTTLVASWLDARKLPSLWYQVDGGDGDLASFFYFMGLAAQKAAPRIRKPLPLFTPEYVLGIPVFTRRYFEALFQRLAPSSVVVLDNFQDAPSASGFHEMIANGLEAVPEDITVIVISRNDPPPPFARLQASGAVAAIDWDEMRFTKDEAGQLLMGLEQRGQRTELTEPLYKKTQGWAAGLVLMCRDTEPESLSGDQTPAALFDYFAGEQFNKAESRMQDFLLQTAFFQNMTARMADQVIGTGQARQMLLELKRKNFFITSDAEAVYQYHPLFHEFLITRARAVLPKEELQSLLRRTASALVESGRPEQAADLFSEAGDWESFVELVLQQAPFMSRQGRIQTLSAWLGRIPSQLHAGCPWIVYWLGVSRAPHHAKEGQAYFEKAYLLFQQSGERVGMLRSWAGAVFTVITSWGEYTSLERYLAWYREQDDGAAFPSPELEAETTAAMTAVLFGIQPDHPDIRRWALHSLDAARNTGVPELRSLSASYAILYFLWAGYFSDALLVYDEIRDITSSDGVPPVVKFTGKWIEANISYWIKYDVTAGLRSFAEIRALATNYGIHIWDHMICSIGIYGALLQGDQEAAEGLLQEMKQALRPEQTQGLSHYHILVAWSKTLSGDATGARAHAERGIKLIAGIAAELFYPDLISRVFLANILCETKEYDGAEAQLEILRDQVVKIGSPAMEFHYFLTRSRIALDKGAEADGVELLRNAMQIGRLQKYVITAWWWQPEVFAALCRKALEEGIEVEYVRSLVKRHKFDPDPDSPSEHWPWQLRINTLGRFEIVLDDQPLSFGSKVQKKPMELLKVLIALGGEASVDRICEALWADADGDQAHRSFESALYRLRKLIGDQVLRLQDGVLELDRRACWVDVWEFQLLMRKGNVATADLGETIRRFDKATRLYRGHFLPHDVHQPWSVSLRERLRSNYIGLVAACGRAWENAGECEQAIACFLKGLETDEHAEEFYQRLMQCHIKLGEHVQAESVYRRCCTVLKHSLGLTPSPRTEAILASIRK